MRAASEPDHEAEAGGEAELSHGYIFLVRWNKRRLVVDSFLDVSAFVGEEGRRSYAVSRLLDRKIPGLDTVATAIRHMDLRRKFNSDMEGPLSARTDTPLTPEDLEQYLNALNQGDLEAFLRRAVWKPSPSWKRA